jgi:DNA invertase Pin-like site-specific DNA recombinase
MMFGYARVSTDAQCLDRQLDELKKYGVDGKNIFQEKYTGTKANRPELDKLKLATRKGDVIVIESLSRLGRSAKDLRVLIEYFDSEGIALVSLKEDIDLSTPSGRLLFSVLSSLCEFERDVIVQRTKEGLEAARARGRSGGRPKKDPKTIQKALKLYDAQTHSTKEIAKLHGISVKTLYNALDARKAGATT